MTEAMAGNTVYVQGSYVDVHDNEVVNLSIDKAGEVRVDGALAAETKSDVALNGDTDSEAPDTEALKVKAAIDRLWEERLMKHLYDYTWVMEVMNESDGLPSFSSPQSFLTYMDALGISRLPDVSSIKKEYGKMLGQFPNWTFQDKDASETNRRINVAKRFLSAYRKG